MVRVLAILVIALAVALIVYRGYKDRALKRAAIGAGVLVWLLFMGTFGMTLRALPLLFIVHYIFLGIAFVALFWFLLRGVMMWWFWLLPALSALLFFMLGFIEKGLLG